MEKAYLFLRKLVALSINVLIYFLLRDILPFYISVPIILIIFSFIVSRILSERPKELFNYKRSESYFAKGGLRDLLRIPQILFGFIHDVVVWEIWGVYQILLLATEIIYFLKQVVFWVLHGVIWVLKHFVPFWRVAYKMFILYQVKWVWWIFKYSFNSLKKAYNWNMIKISVTGAFTSLLIYQFFYFLEITLSIFGLKFIGVVLALLPVSWVFGEIASIRGQNLMFAPYSEVKSKMRNGLESVRGLLFFITFFVVIFIAQAALAWFSWLKGPGIVLTGFALNINFIFNVVLILLGILIVFTVFVLPVYRLYNKFSETTFSDVYKLFIHIVKRSLQNLAGFIPSAFFALIAAIPPAILVGLAMFCTMQVKEAVAKGKIDKLKIEQSNAQTQVESYRISKQIDRLESTIQFPAQFFQDISHKQLLENEKTAYEKEEERLELEFSTRQTNHNNTTKELKALIEFEKSKDVINQTRIEEYEQSLKTQEISYQQFMIDNRTRAGMREVDIAYLEKQVKQTNILFYLSGLFTVVALTLILTFVLSYYGNFFYRSYLFRNDGTQAEWKTFIQTEKEYNKNQPLLSTTLNVIALLILAGFILKWVEVDLLKVLSYIIRYSIHG